MLRGGTGAEKSGNQAEQEPKCQGVVQDRVEASVSICTKHQTLGDVRGKQRSCPMPDHDCLGGCSSPGSAPTPVLHHQNQ